MIGGIAGEADRLQAVGAGDGQRGAEVGPVEERDELAEHERQHDEGRHVLDAEPHHLRHVGCVVFSDPLAKP